LSVVLEFRLFNGRMQKGAFC